jgi:hypothetical protein
VEAVLEDALGVAVGLTMVVEVTGLVELFEASLFVVALLGVEVLGLLGASTVGVCAVDLTVDTLGVESAFELPVIGSLPFCFNATVCPSLLPSSSLLPKGGFGTTGDLVRLALSTVDTCSDWTFSLPVFSVTALALAFDASGAAVSLPMA